MSLPPPPHRAPVPRFLLFPNSCYSPTLTGIPNPREHAVPPPSIPHPAGTGMSSRTTPCHELLRQVEHHLGPVPSSSFHGWDGRLRFLPSRGRAWRPLDHDVSTGKPLRGSTGHGHKQPHACSHDRPHRQVILRPERHLLAGGKGGFRCFPGPCSPD